VPDGGGQREDLLHDADDDASGCAAVVLFEVELPLELEGLVDRLDDLPHPALAGRYSACPKLRCHGAFPQFGGLGAGRFTTSRPGPSTFANGWAIKRPVRRR
jgi:hypothetical protein